MASNSANGYTYLFEHHKRHFSLFLDPCRALMHDVTGVSFFLLDAVIDLVNILPGYISIDLFHLCVHRSVYSFIYLFMYSLKMLNCEKIMFAYIKAPLPRSGNCVVDKVDILLVTSVLD